MSKYIFITGGVVSSLGKGLTSASLGMLLERRGLRIRMQKLDPYLNVDAGTMNPYQHGEVYVTDDGGETDLDLGHYERFTNSPLTRASNVTTGAIYDSVIRRERQGAFDGACVQVVPHITDEIKSRILQMGGPDVDVVLCEIGGTVGDIESLPFLETLRQLALELGPTNVAFIHLTLLPYVRASGEMKTKPSQHSVRDLREIGIQPDVLMVRTEQAIDDSIRRKLSLFCNVPEKHVIEVRDVETSIYEVPLILRRQKIDDALADRLALPGGAPDLSDWEEMVHVIRNPEGRVTIAVVGKYIELPDAYKSIYEALTHGGIANRVKVYLKKVNSALLTPENVEEHLGNADGILVPGGFGERGIEGKIIAARYAREHRIPYFGICLGMQCQVIEFARNVLHLAKSHSSEFSPDGPDPIIHLMTDQRGVTQRGGTMRLGKYACDLMPGSRAHDAYGSEQVHERHRHRFEFNPAYRMRCESHGLRFSGINPETSLVEIAEVVAHPWMVGVQFHPEYRSKPTKAHPLFRGFVAAAVTHSRGGAPGNTPNGAMPATATPAAAASTTPPVAPAPSAAPAPEKPRAHQPSVADN
ncbi:MAG: CTP synthase [Planctomycetota bacterium]